MHILKIITDCPQTDPDPYSDQLPKSHGPRTLSLWKFFSLGV